MCQTNGDAQRVTDEWHKNNPKPPDEMQEVDEPWSRRPAYDQAIVDKHGKPTPPQVEPARQSLLSRFLTFFASN